MADNVQWAHVMRKLLPPGKLFDEMDTPPAVGAGPVLWRMLKAFGWELKRFEQRVYQALVEMDPRTADETLEWWEKAYGLPDVRIPVLPTTLAGRRAAVALKVVMKGAQNAAAYSALCMACGWTLIECRRFWFYEPFTCESECEAYVDGVDWACTVEFLVGGETVDSLPLADLTRTLKWTMQAHANCLVTYVP